MKRSLRPIIEGVDTSVYQGTVNWEQAHRQGGKAFGIVKGTEGEGFFDPQFGHSWNALHQLGMPRLVYSFLHDSISGIAQAEYLVRSVNAGHQFRHGDGIAADLEEGYISSASAGIDCLLGFIRTCWRLAKRPVVIYTNYDVWVNLLGNPTHPVFEVCPLWLADLGPTVPRLKPWPKGPSFMQYSFHGHCPGIAGEVDLDRFYGSVGQLRTLLADVPHV